MDKEAIMSSPTVDDRERRTRRQSDGALRVERLRERAAEMRRSAPHPEARVAPQLWPRIDLAESRTDRRDGDRSANDQRRDESPGRGPAPRRRELENVRDRMDRARAEDLLTKVRTSEWWDNATAGDLERARRVASAGGTPPSSRAAIRTEMQDVAQRRYGSSVDGAIRYERENPNQPPPDLRPSHGRTLLGPRARGAISYDSDELLTDSPPKGSRKL